MATEFRRRRRAEARAHVDDEAHAGDRPSTRRVWALTRISLGFVFLWAFVDKLLGLGFSTPAERAWLRGGSPTRGFLLGVEGPAAPIFTPLAGNAVVDVLFMAGLLLLGLALLLGVGMRVAAVSGALLMMLMWLALLPLETNPFMDDHVVYALVLVGLALARAGRTWGLGAWWAETDLVQRHPWLE